MTRRAGWMFVGFALIGSSAAAQDAPALRPHAVVVGGGLVWTGGYSLGATSVDLRGNAPGATPPPFTLLTMDSSMQSVVGAEARVGFTLTPALAVEAGVAFASPAIAVSISGDAETPATELAEAEKLHQYVIAGGIVWQIPGVRLGARARPFVTGGGAYLRQLYDERTLVETGHIIYAGGGVRWWLRGGSGAGQSLGVRADARVNWRAGGVEFDDAVRVFPSVGVSLFWQP